MTKFSNGNLVKIRDEEDVCRIVCEITDEDGSVWYEVEAVEFSAPFNREVRESDLKFVNS